MVDNGAHRESDDVEPGPTPGGGAPGQATGPETHPVGFGLVVDAATPDAVVARAGQQAGVALSRVDDGGSVLVPADVTVTSLGRVIDTLVAAGVRVHRVTDLPTTGRPEPLSVAAVYTNALTAAYADPPPAPGHDSGEPAGDGASAQHRVASAVLPQLHAMLDRLDHRVAQLWRTRATLVAEIGHRRRQTGHPAYPYTAQLQSDRHYRAVLGPDGGPLARLAAAQWLRRPPSTPTPAARGEGSPR